MSMLLGIVSDTHANVASCREAIGMLESLGPEVVIHCGDIGSVDIVRQFVAWPTHFVFGNVDGDRDGLEQAIVAAGHTCHDEFGSLELAGRRIAFLHGDDTQRLRRAIYEDGWDLVCHGHTHVATQYRQGDTMVLNPGALHRARPHSLAIVELAEMKATIVPL